MKAEKVVYYSDSLKDDFAGTNIKAQSVGGDFPFLHKSRIWNFAAFLLYYMVASPLVFIISKVYLGLKFENRQVVKKLKNTGFYLYGNHTRDLDAFIPPMVAFPKKAHIIANSDAVSIPFLHNVVQMLGAIPVPDSLSGMKGFTEAVFYRCKEKKCVAIFPEAHVWPFYTGIRPFPDTSFHYPVKDGSPVIAMVTTYRKRKGVFLLSKRPGMTVTLSEPMYIDSTLPPKKAQKELRDRVYSFMTEISSTKENIEYIKYVKKTQNDPENLRN